MRRLWPVVISVAALAVASLLTIPASAGEKDFKTRLSGFEEVPANSTPASGEFEAKLDKSETVLEFELTYADLSAPPSAAHIHLGQRSANGGVIAFLCGGGSKPACPPSPATITGTIDASDVTGPGGQGIAPGEFAEVIAALRAGVVYANVHNSMFPGGEIRGQVK